MKRTIISIIASGGILGAGVFLVFGGYAIIEPSQLTAATATTTSSVTLTVDEEISISASGGTTLSPNVGVSQDSSVGSSVWTVTTNSTAGYTLEFTTSQANALISGSDYFTDISTTTPINWDIAVATSTYVWGYSAYGTHVATSTWGNAAACGTAGASTFSTSLSYGGFATTTTNAPTVASTASETGVSGATTTLCVAVEQDAVFAPSGSYSATVTGTATTQ